MRTVRPLLFVDTETTGLDPQKQEIIEVAAILTSPDGQMILDEFEAKVRPLKMETAEPKALEINGYTEEKWAPELCKPHKEVAEKFYEMSKKAVLVAHNVSFDEAFMAAFVLQHLEKKGPWSYHKIDTVGLAYPLFIQDEKIESLGLATLAPYLKLPHQPNHSARADVLACRDLFLLLMERLGKSLELNPIG